MRKKQKIINVFDDQSVYAVKHVISITDEEDLNQLWEYILAAHSQEESETYSFFVSLYELSERFFKSFPEIFFEIIIEHSDKYFYFTVWNKEFIYFVKEHWAQRGIEYTHNEKRISVRLLKQYFQKKIHNDDLRISHLLATVKKIDITENIPPHTFIESRDLRELMELSDDLNAYLYEVLRVSLDNDSLIRIRSYFSLISVILNHYEEVEEMAIIMTEFSMMINQNKEDFFSLNSDQIELIEGYAHNFERWLKVLFIYGGAEVNFMNRSMRADMETIRAMTQPMVDITSEDIDAIFDF